MRLGQIYISPINKAATFDLPMHAAAAVARLFERQSKQKNSGEISQEKLMCHRH
jgi:hypothetical protein